MTTGLDGAVPAQHGPRRPMTADGTPADGTAAESTGADGDSTAGAASGGSGGPGGGLTGTAARQGALGLVGAVVAGAGGLTLTVVVGRLLTPAEAGTYFTAVAAFTILATVLLLGADTGLVRALSGARAAGGEHLLRPYLRTALRPVTALAAAAAVLVVAAGLVLARPDAGGDPSATSPAGVAVLLGPFLLPATVSVLLLNGASRGLGSMRTFTAVQQILLPIARPVLIAVVLATAGALGAERTAELALAAWAAPLLVALALAARSVSRTLTARELAAREMAAREMAGRSGSGGAGPAAAQAVPTDLRSRFWRTTAPRGVAATFEIVIVWADVILVAALAGPAPAGIYAAASRFVTSGTFALQAVRLSVGPLLAGAFARGDTATAAAIHRLSIRWAVLSTWPVYLTLAVFAPGVLAILGPGYAPAAGALSLLSLAMLAVVAAGNANTVLNMAHRSGWAAANTGAATVVMLGLDLILVPRHGVLGAAVGWSAAMLTDAVASTIEVRRGLGVRAVDASVVRAPVVVLVAFGGPALAVRLAADAAGLAPLPTLLAGGLVAGACYAATLAVLRRALGLDEIVTALRRPRGRTETTPTSPGGP